MRVTLNGNVTVEPTGRPNTVEVYHRFQSIVKKLESVKDRFERTDPYDSPKLMKLRLETRPLIDEYMEVVPFCSKEIERLSKVENDSNYYKILHIFLKRATANDHNIVPYAKYLISYTNHLSVENGPFVVDPIGTSENLWNFVRSRITESIELTRSYMCLLSASMDSSLKEIDIGTMLSNVLQTQKLLYLLKGSNEFEHFESKSNEDVYEKFKENYNNIQFVDNYKGKITSFEPLMYILPMYLITNALKASFQASVFQIYSEERGHDNFLKNVGLYGIKTNPEHRQKYIGKLPLITKPEVKLEINPFDEKNISISVIDNGIGIEKNDLYRIFTFQTDFNVFGGYVESGGSTMQIIPHILDLTGITLHAESEIGKGAKFELIVPKVPSWN